MKIRLVLLALCASLACAAEPTGHQKAAAELVDLVSGPKIFRAAFLSGLDRMTENLQQRGAPEEMLDEIRGTFTEWLEQEIVWDELKPELVALYVREFSESDLQATLAFYRTPAGQKALQKLPKLLQEGAKIGQAYAAKKEPGLNSRLEKVMAKYQAQPPAQPAQP